MNTLYLVYYFLSVHFIFFAFPFGRYLFYPFLFLIIFAMNLQIGKLDVGVVEGAGFSPEQLAAVDKQAVEYEITMLEERLKQMTPNMAAIEEFKRKVGTHTHTHTHTLIHMSIVLQMFKTHSFSLHTHARTPPSLPPTGTTPCGASGRAGRHNLRA